MSALAKLREHGQKAEACGDKLIVYPSERLNDELRDYIRQCKAEIVTELEELALNRWLDHIGEFHQPSRDECLERCRLDPEVRAYFLERAKEAVN